MLWLKTLIGILLQAIFLALFIYVPAGTIYWSDAQFGQPCFTN